MNDIFKIDVHEIGSDKFLCLYRYDETYGEFDIVFGQTINRNGHAVPSGYAKFSERLSDWMYMRGVAWERFTEINLA